MPRRCRSGRHAACDERGVGVLASRLGDPGPADQPVRLAGEHYLLVLRLAGAHRQGEQQRRPRLVRHVDLRQAGTSQRGQLVGGLEVEIRGIDPFDAHDPILSHRRSEVWIPVAPGGRRRYGGGVMCARNLLLGCRSEV